MSFRDGAIGVDQTVLAMVENVDPDTCAAATRAVLERVERGQLTHADAYRVLEALGLLPYESAGRYTPEGHRIRPGRQKRSQKPPQPSADDAGSPNPTEGTFGVLGPTEGERGAS